MMTIEELCGHIFYYGTDHGEVLKSLRQWRREILTEAAERAVQWWTTPMQEWHNERLMNPKESIRRAVMGEEVEG
jgi:hypothetical protein